MVSKKRRCVGIELCPYHLGGILTLDLVCISADDWLARNPRNYVGVYFGLTY